jgi:hypothetical protein
MTATDIATTNISLSENVGFTGGAAFAARFVIDLDVTLALPTAIDPSPAKPTPLSLELVVVLPSSKIT